jgi:hypothetical protein
MPVCSGQSIENCHNSIAPVTSFILYCDARICCNVISRGNTAKDMLALSRCLGSSLSACVGTTLHCHQCWQGYKLCKAAPCEQPSIALGSPQSLMIHCSISRTLSCSSAGCIVRTLLLRHREVFSC